MKPPDPVALAILLFIAVPAYSQTIPASSHQSDAATDSISAAPAAIFLGRIESCAINPPLSLLPVNVVEATKDGDSALRPLGAQAGSVTVAAFEGGREAKNRPITALVIDVLAVSQRDVRSTTGEAWKIYQPDPAQESNRLVAKSTDYSVCRVGEPVATDPTLEITEIAALDSKLLVSPAYATTLNILGLSPESYVRLRLNSVPPDADIILDGIRQPARTNTVLDVLAGVIPRLRIEKSGFEPCSLGRGTLTLVRAPRRTVTATCDLKRQK